jgi:tungstate transport system permease protein
MDITEVFTIIGISLKLTFISVMISSLIGIPLAWWIDNLNLKARKTTTAFFQSLTAIPTVVVGLFVYSVISRKGIFGWMGLLFQQEAIIIGQTLLGIPILVTYLLTGFSKNDIRLKETLLTLGADTLMRLWITARESRFIILSGLMGCFGRIIGEVGVSMMLGGNIRFKTRTMTTAIAMETGKGEFYTAIFLGVALLGIAILVNLSGHFLVRRERE